MPLLRKLEEVLVQLVRVVLLAFAIVILLAIASYLWDKTLGKKDEAANSSMVWSDIQPDLQFVLEETGRDMGLAVPDVAFQDSLSDPALRPSFQKADRLVRDFVAAKAEHHQQIEKDNESLGLAPLNPLLEGDSIPTKAQIEAYAQAQSAQEQANAENMERLVNGDDRSQTTAEAAAVAAADASAVDAAVDAAACCDSSNTLFWTPPVDVSRVLYERAVQTRSQYNAQAYAAFIQGAPQAIERVLSDATLAPKLHDLPVSRLVDMVMTNYDLSFSRAVNDQDSSNEGLWDRFFNSLELTMWSVIMSFLVMVVLVVMSIRVEHHLRRISDQQTPR